MFATIAQNSSYFTATHAQEQAERSVAAGAAALQEHTHEETVQKTRTIAAEEETRPDGRKKDSVELSREAQEIRKLQTRDQEVRAHEAAHAAAGGSYAGAPSFSFERGPDGKSYAVGGEVSIDVSPISGDPQATLQKAQQVRAAALAPAEPSGQDMKVAQRAQSMAAKARTELATQQSELLKSAAVEGGIGTADATDGSEKVSSGNASSATPSASNASSSAAPIARLNVYA
ncbi:MAG TPA: putative metalloprotease CJM1_0395 family protein [Malonomonas sp.]